METGITLSIYPDDSYHYDAVANIDEIAVVYKENGVEKTRVAFGTIEEMEALAKAMLRVLNLAERCK
jgi:hypothetical protein